MAPGAGADPRHRGCADARQNLAYGVGEAARQPDLPRRGLYRGRAGADDGADGGVSRWCAARACCPARSRKSPTRVPNISAPRGACGSVHRARGQAACAGRRRLVVTAGRSPDTDGLGLAETGVERGRRGAIRVGADMQTTATGICAAGDVTDRGRFVCRVAYGAKLAARNPVLGGAGATTTPPYPGSSSPIRRWRISDRSPSRHGIMAPECARSARTLAMAPKSAMTKKAPGETIFACLTTVESLKRAARAADFRACVMLLKIAGDAPLEIEDAILAEAVGAEMSFAMSYARVSGRKR